ncbi:transposase [Methyloversatilis sp.]|uniref:REP-associated tyrosine transposase n=2 Tax=Methyloversatilis sp. TaxID=2569862 RepID=UPI002733EFDF|nr:transposase [Methyloversatilis sp.]MDP3454762.1 transposase [Methyloversatilis sp.]
MSKVFHASRLRTGRVSISRQVYHVTTATHGRERTFESMYAARSVIRSLMFAERRGDGRTLAFVLMPDHLHWMVELGDGLSISRVVQQMKLFSAREIGHRVWQRGFHDHALRADEDIAHVARYLIANPLRAGLVQRVADYPHWDAVWV